MAARTSRDLVVGDPLQRLVARLASLSPWLRDSKAKTS